MRTIWPYACLAAMMFAPSGCLTQEAEKAGKPSELPLISFDDKTEVLPEGYKGQDFDSLFAYLSENVTPVIFKGKDEFETTAQYDQRIRQLMAQPILGTLTLQDPVAFVLEPFRTPYDADSQKFTAGVDLAPGGLLLVRSTSAAYVDELYLANSGDFGGESRLAQEIQMDPAEAKEKKNRLQILAICKLVTPFASSGGSSLGKVHTLRVELLQLWFYDPPSGRIYAKIARRGAPFHVQTSAGTVARSTQGGTTSEPETKAEADSPAIGGPTVDPSVNRTVDFSYDRFRDVTVVKSRTVDLLKSEGKTLSLDAFYVCPHKTRCRPASISLNFYAATDVSEGWQYMRDHDLDLLADGRRFSLETSWDGEVDSENFLFEPMHADIALADFLTLTKARSLEVRLGADELTLDGDAKDSLRALAESCGK